MNRSGSTPRRDKLRYSTRWRPVRNITKLLHATAQNVRTHTASQTFSEGLFNASAIKLKGKKSGRETRAIESTERGIRAGR